MGTYFNDDAKQILYWIVEIWLEKVAENEKLPESERLPIEKLAPTPTEFDNDPRCSLKANSLATNCNKWNSFSAATSSLSLISHIKKVVAARNAGEKEPDPPSYLMLASKKPATAVTATPAPTAPSAAKPTPKKRVTSQPKKSAPEEPVSTFRRITEPDTPPKVTEAPPVPKESATPLKAAEAPPAPKTPDSPTPTPRTAQKPPKAAPMYRNFSFGSKNPDKKQAQKRDPHATLTQSIGSLIPPEVLASFENNDAPPKKKQKKASEPPVVTEEIAQDDNDFASLSIINYLPGKLAFISKNYYLSYKSGNIQLGQSYQIALEGDDDTFAKVIKVKKTLAEYKADSNEGDLQIALTEIYCSPKIESKGVISDFPAPRSGHLLLVEKEVAEAARNNGRSTDDLIFPRFYLRTDNNIFLCVELGKL